MLLITSSLAHTCSFAVQSRTALIKRLPVIVIDQKRLRQLTVELTRLMFHQLFFLIDIS